MIVAIYPVSWIEVLLPQDSWWIYPRTFTSYNRFCYVQANYAIVHVGLLITLVKKSRCFYNTRVWEESISSPPRRGWRSSTCRSRVGPWLCGVFFLSSTLSGFWQGVRSMGCTKTSMANVADGSSNSALRLGSFDFGYHPCGRNVSMTLRHQVGLFDSMWNTVGNRILTFHKGSKSY